MKKVLLFILISFILSNDLSAGGCASREAVSDEEPAPSYSFSFRQYFEFAKSFDNDEEVEKDDQQIIERSCENIAADPLGNVLLKSICDLLEQEQKKLAFFPDSNTCYDQAKTRKIPDKIFIAIGNTNGSTVMRIKEYGNDGDTTAIEQPFINILRHELIHAYHFLEDPQSYRKNVMQSQSDMWAMQVNQVWPSLKEIEDSLNVPNLWVFRPEEVLTVLGSEEESITQEEQKERSDKKVFSEIAFTCNTSQARAPYHTEKYASFHKQSRQTFFKSAKLHRKKLLKQRH